VLDVLALAGGFNQFAPGTRLVVIRMEDARKNPIPANSTKSSGQATSSSSCRRFPSTPHGIAASVSLSTLAERRVSPTLSARGRTAGGAVGEGSRGGGEDHHAP
jgi:hypothetical protein